MKNKTKIISFAILLIIAREFLKSYSNSYKYWEYINKRGQYFTGRYLKYKFLALFSSGEIKNKYLALAEQNKRKAAWYGKQTIDKNI